MVPIAARAALAAQRLTDPTYLFPWVVVARGCVFDCPGCYAARGAQEALAGRGMVARPAVAVREDLEYWSHRAEIRWCHFNSDFLTTIGRAWAEEALAGRFDLTAYYEWYRVPETEDLDLVLSRFRSVVFGFFLRPDAECAQPTGGAGCFDPARLTIAARHVRGRARMLLYVTPAFAADAAYLRRALALRRMGGAELKAFEDAAMPAFHGTDEPVRRAGFDRLLTDSRGRRRTLRLQHALLRFAITRAPRLYGWLWRMSNAPVLARMFQKRLTVALRGSGSSVP